VLLLGHCPRGGIRRRGSNVQVLIMLLLLERHGYPLWLRVLHDGHSVRGATAAQVSTCLTNVITTERKYSRSLVSILSPARALLARIRVQDGGIAALMSRRAIVLLLGGSTVMTGRRRRRGNQSLKLVSRKGDRLHQGCIEDLGVKALGGLHVQSTLRIDNIHNPSTLFDNLIASENG
jgi:hypothetical protein